MFYTHIIEHMFCIFYGGLSMIISEKDNRIDVICQFTRNAEIIPIKIRITDEDGVRQEYSIQAYKDTTPGQTNVQPNGVKVSPDNKIFLCKINTFNSSRQIKLFYNSHEHLWRLAE